MAFSCCRCQRPPCLGATHPPTPSPAGAVCRHVTVGVAAPDCWERTVLLVNGQLSPTLELVQGEELQVREGHEAGISVEEWV